MATATNLTASLASPNQEIGMKSVQGAQPLRLQAGLAFAKQPHPLRFSLKLFLSLSSLDEKF
jgi:hypothetical protein